MNKMSKLGLTVGIAASLFLMSQKLKGQTTDNLAHNLQQTEETRGTALTSENFLTSLGVNITDPNEKKLIETVRGVLDDKSRAYTEKFFNTHTQELSPKDRTLYIKRFLYTLYQELAQSQNFSHATNVEALREEIGVQIPDEVYEKADEEYYEEYSKGLARLRQQAIAEANGRITDANGKIIEYRERGIEADKKTEDVLREFYKINQKGVVSNEALRGMIEVKNNLRRFQKEKTYIPVNDIETILQRLEQLEQSEKVTAARK